MTFVAKGIEAALEPGRTPASESVFADLVRLVGQLSDETAKRKVLNALNVEAIRRAFEPIPTQFTKTPQG